MIAVNLKAEHMLNPIGLDADSIFLSWQCTEGQYQTAFQILAQCGGKTVWDSGKIKSDAMHCLYGEALASRQKVVWQVRLWDDKDAPGAWSDTACFEMGITEAAEWKAAWIFPADEPMNNTENAIDRRAIQAWQEKKCKGTYPPHKPASYYKTVFTAQKNVPARLYITAHGVYEAFINGKRVGDYLLAPGPAVYDRYQPCQTYDITDFLDEGENEIVCLVGDGWYRSCSGVNGDRNLYGDKTALLLQIMQENQILCRTDSSWQVSTDGPLQQNDMQQGEVVDARRNAPRRWAPVQTQPADASLLCGDNSVPIVENEHFPGTIIKTPDGSTVVDFGQNLAGGIEFWANAHTGQRIFLMCGEALDAQGNFTQENFQNRRRHKEGGTHQMVEYICRDGENHYKTKFCIFGFRYALLKTDVPIEALRIESFAVYSRMEQAGHFTCGAAEINQLVQNCLWSQKSNFCGIPTDCPTRERAGWTGDAGVFADAGLYLMECVPIFRKWLQDCRFLQSAGGKIANIAPVINRPGFMTERLSGSVAWGDACILVPWALYNHTGDARILAENYAMMQRWYSYLEKRAKKMTVSKWLEHNPYKNCLIQSGIDYGEWCEPGVNNYKEMMNPKKSVSTAYLAYSGKILSEIAGILGHAADRDHFAETSRNAAKAYVYAYTDKGTITGSRQCEYVRALQFDLLPVEKQQAAAQALARQVADNGWHLNTGFLSTPYLCSVLMRYGYTDTAEKLLLQDSYPSWLYEVKKGATTIWENWDGVDAQGNVKASLNHYSYGAVAGSLFEAAGIRITSQGVEIKPYILKALRFARCSYMSCFGIVKSGWQLIGENAAELEISIPPNCKAQLHLPEKTIAVEPGVHRYTISL